MNPASTTAPDANSIVQLCPAPGWHAVYRNQDGGEFSSPIIAWGVQRDGTVVALDADANGLIDRADEQGNFVRLEQRPSNSEQCLERIAYTLETTTFS